MKVSVETVSSVERKLTVEVDAERVAKALERAYKGLSRQVKVPGFRPGKVPRRILESRYKDQVEQEVLQALVADTYLEALKGHELAPVASPVVFPDRLEEGKPFKYEARVEVKPALAPKDYKGLDLEPAKVEVTDAMVDEELARLQDTLSEFVPVTDRASATTGDYATIDTIGTVEGKEFGSGKNEGITVRVEPGNLLEGQAPMLAGVTVGETITTEVEFPADFREESMRGKKAEFRITLKAIKRREVPPLDDELAKDLGGEAKTLAELKVKIREELQDRETSRAQRETRDRLLRALIAKNPVEVPKAMVERAIDMMMSGATERFARQGIDLRQLGLDFRKLREDLREKALEEVQGALLLEAISKQEGIDVTDEDVSAKIGQLAKDSGAPEAKVRAHFERDADEKAALRSRLREEKTLELLRREAKVGAGA